MSRFCVDEDSANHNQRANGLFSQSEQPRQGAVHWHSQQPPLSPGLCQCFLQQWGGLGIPLPSCLSSCALSLCPSNQSTGPGTVTEIQSSEEALIHHASPAPCHLNAKYFHCIFKSKQEKKWAQGASGWKGQKLIRAQQNLLSKPLAFWLDSFAGRVNVGEEKLGERNLNKRPRELVCSNLQKRDTK